MIQTTTTQDERAKLEQQLEDELTRAEAETAASLEYAQSLGLKLPDAVLDMAEWLTLKRYAERYNLSIQTVQNWVSRGIIPADCTQVVPELNDLRLVKNQAYK